MACLAAPFRRLSLLEENLISEAQIVALRKGLDGETPATELGRRRGIYANTIWRKPQITQRLVQDRSKMYKSIAVPLLILIACAVSSPARAQPCVATSHVGQVTPASRELAQRINRRGFEAFSQLDAARGWQDNAVSPFALWYLNSFVDVNWRSAHGVVAAALLRHVSEHSDFTSTVWANSQTTTFGSDAAARALRIFCASTKWAPWSDSSKIPQSTDFMVGLSLSRSFAVAARGSNVFARLPSFDDGTLRGIRLDSNDGRTSVYLLWGTAENIRSFRKSMNATRWASLASQFYLKDDLLDDLSLQRSSYTELMPDGIESFGTVLFPGFALPHAIVSNQTIMVGNEGVRFAISAAFYGYTIKPTKVIVNGAAQYRRVAYSVSADPGSTIPLNRRFSTVKPVIYVIEDRGTGTILLLGIHE